MPLAADHADYLVLNAITNEVLQRAGDEEGMAKFLPQMLRDSIDEVIKTPKTNRRSYDELEKTEKTYIGTLVEIALRHFLGLKRGRFDLVVDCEDARYDVDVKTTLSGGSWMIPQEVIGYPCILVSASEATAKCSIGTVVARPEYLTSAANRDRKLQISAAGRANIWWWLRDSPYPPNFWRTVDPGAVERIFSYSTGNARVVGLFREVQGRPVSRAVIEAVAAQKDFMRRVRADGSRGTRARLAAEGILLLSGTFDAALIATLGLSRIGPSEFLAHRVRDEAEVQLARDAGYGI